MRSRRKFHEPARGGDDVEVTMDQLVQDDAVPRIDHKERKKLKREAFLKKLSMNMVENEQDKHGKNKKKAQEKEPVKDDDKAADMNMAFELAEALPEVESIIQNSLMDKVKFERASVRKAVWYVVMCW